MFFRRTEPRARVPPSSRASPSRRLARRPASSSPSSRVSRERNDARGTTRETARRSEGDAAMRMYVSSIARRLVSIPRSRPSRVSRARFRRRRDAPLFRDEVDGWMDGAGSRWRGTHRPVVNPRCMYGSMGRGRRGRTTGRVARCGAVRDVMCVSGVRAYICKYGRWCACVREGERARRDPRAPRAAAGRRKGLFAVGGRRVRRR